MLASEPVSAVENDKREERSNLRARFGKEKAKREQRTRLRARFGKRES